MDTEKLEQLRKDLLDLIVMQCKSKGMTLEETQREVMEDKRLRYINDSLVDVAMKQTTVNLTINLKDKPKGDIMEYMRGLAGDIKDGGPIKAGKTFVVGEEPITGCKFSKVNLPGFPPATVTPGEEVAGEFQVWSEGYRAQGNEAHAQLMGTVAASSFQAACDQLFEGDRSYDSKRLTCWGCRLFDNEADARKTFG